MAAGLATLDHPPSSIRRLLHHTPEVVINSISEVPRLADVTIRRAV